MPTSLTHAIARLTDVSKRFGSVRALDGVGFDLNAGELCALLGRNGAGKTTAIRLLLGLSKPDAGQVRLLGEAPGSMAARRRIGAMLQKTDLPGMLRVGELIDHFAAAYPAPLARDEVLATTGLTGLETRPYAKLSGGQQRLVQFAIALCGDPDLLLLDEPSTGLDADVRQTLWSSIRGLLDRGKTILLTTHYLPEAEALADRILLLKDGTLIADDTPDSIKARTGGKRIRCRTSLVDTQLASLAGVDQVARQGAMVQIVTAQVEDCLRQLLQSDPALADLTVSDTGLEDAFLSLTEDRSDLMLGDAA